MKVIAVEGVGGIVPNDGRYVGRYRFVRRLDYTLEDGSVITDHVSAERRDSLYLSTAVACEREAIDAGNRVERNGMICATNPGAE